MTKKKMKRSADLQIVFDREVRTFASAGVSQKLGASAAQSLGELSLVLAEAAKSFKSALATAKPSKVELALNLTLEAEGKWLIVQGKGAATVGVTLTWEYGA